MQLNDLGTLLLEPDEAQLLEDIILEEEIRQATPEE